MIMAPKDTDMAKRYLRQTHENPLFLDDDELDALRSLLVSILMKDSNLDKEEIYSYTFGGGRKILWH